MKKILAFAAGVAVLLPMAASAATFSNPLFSNGDTAIDVNGGATVSGTYTLVVDQNEAVEFLRCWADNQPFTDVSLGGNLGKEEGTYVSQSFSAKVGPNTGNVNIWCQGAGRFGGPRSIHGGDNVVVGPVNMGMVRVTANSSTVGTGAPTMADLQAQVTALLAQLNCTNNGGTWSGNACVPKPAPTTSTACTTLAAKMSGTQMYVYNDANVSLQGLLLMNNPNSIPALKAGSKIPFGYYGDQTSAAVSAYKTQHGCI